MPRVSAVKSKKGKVPLGNVSKATKKTIVGEINWSVTFAKLYQRCYRSEIDQSAQLTQQQQRDAYSEGQP